MMITKLLDKIFGYKPGRKMYFESIDWSNVPVINHKRTEANEFIQKMKIIYGDDCFKRCGSDL